MEIDRFFYSSRVTFSAIYRKYEKPNIMEISNLTDDFTRKLVTPNRR